MGDKCMKIDINSLVQSQAGKKILYVCLGALCTVLAFMSRF